MRRDVWVAAGAAMATALVGGALTQIGPWYLALEKPAWQPPDWVFAPAWTLIYTLSAIAAVIGWRALAGRPGAQTVLLVLFGLNAVLNVLWSGLFFTAQRPDWALIEAVALFLSVAALIVALWRPAPRGALLLAPYLVWVGFATVLNRAIVELNGPFA